MDNLSPLPTPPPIHPEQPAPQPPQHAIVNTRQPTAVSTSPPTTPFVQRVSDWLKENKAAKAARLGYGRALDDNDYEGRFRGTINNRKEPLQLPSWVFEDIRPRSSSALSPTPVRSAGVIAAPTAAAPAAVTGAVSSTTELVYSLVPLLERMTADDFSANTTPTQTPAPVPLPPQQLLQQEQEQLQLRALHGYHISSGPSATYRRTQSKYKQPWRRTRPEMATSRRNPARRLQQASSTLTTTTNDDTDMPLVTAATSSGGPGSSNSTTSSMGDLIAAAEEQSSRTTLYLPHDILLAIISHLPSRANAQQYYDRTQPSDLLSCSRVNMAWRIAALSTIWQTILLPDPLDRSCRRLLHLLASSHASAQITGKNYDITEIVQRVEVDLLEATEQLAEERMEAAACAIANAIVTEDQSPQEQESLGVVVRPRGAVVAVADEEYASGSDTPPPHTTLSASGNDIASSSRKVTSDIATKLAAAAATAASTSASSKPSRTTKHGTMTDHITTLLQFISPFRTLSIQLPQEIESSAADVLTRSASIPALEAIRRGIQEAQIRELDMPSPMYCSVSTFPGMLDLISDMQALRVLILGYSSRDWPLLKAIISLPLLENLCVFDSCWSNQIWIYLFSSLGAQLRGLTVLQGRRPLQGIVLREGIAPYCRNLTTLSIPFIKLMSGPGPVLTDQDVIPVLKTCHELQVINLSGQQLLGDKVLEAMADLWGLQTLDIRECPLMTGQNIKSVRWQSIQRVRMFGCGEMSSEFMDLILQAWRSSHVNTGGSSTSASTSGSSGHHHHHHHNHHHHSQGKHSIGGLGSTTSAGGVGSSSSATIMRFASVLDFHADVEDPVEMGWVRQREDEPPLDLDEDHFFADWYC
ncbi:hypothetical protein BGZ96_009216 [Linnemannia gamsii]|uniref:F-box domain-containing protein n=1 Tax=Linnemannia gamsii TaxID=64522 RepID=A0ABQ7JX85_9FUNG|nr:hypothetical protein BGZ96_009216 [Linnemannia gamsii]